MSNSKMIESLPCTSAGSLHAQFGDPAKTVRLPKDGYLLIYDYDITTKLAQ